MALPGKVTLIPVVSEVKEISRNGLDRNCLFIECRSLLADKGGSARGWMELRRVLHRGGSLSIKAKYLREVPATGIFQAKPGDFPRSRWPMAGLA